MLMSSTFLKSHINEIKRDAIKYNMDIFIKINQNVFQRLGQDKNKLI